MSSFTELVEEFGNDESHPLVTLMEVIGLLIEKYEDDSVSEHEESGILREQPSNE